MKKNEQQYALVGIGYSDHALPLDQAHALQRACVGLLKADSRWLGGRNYYFLLRSDQEVKVILPSDALIDATMLTSTEWAEYRDFCSNQAGDEGFVLTPPNEWLRLKKEGANEA